MLLVATDDDPFSRAYRLHYAPLARFLTSFGLGASDADDVVQETFLRLARHGGAIPPDRVRFWLFRVARNLALNERRRGRTWSAVRPLIRVSGGDADAESAMASREDVDRCLALLNALPDDWRAIVILREIEGMSYAEIAATLEVTTAKVKTNLFRARCRLRDELRRMR